MRKRGVGWLLPWALMDYLTRWYCWADLVTWKLGWHGFGDVNYRERCAAPAYQVCGECWCGLVKEAQAALGAPTGA